MMNSSIPKVGFYKNKQGLDIEDDSSSSEKKNGFKMWRFGEYEGNVARLVEYLPSNNVSVGFHENETEKSSEVVEEALGFTQDVSVGFHENKTEES